MADQTAERLEELRERAAVAYDFRNLEPNFGHEAAALLLREGLIQLISVNWDCGVELAGLRADVKIEGVATAAQRLQLVEELPIYKVHGCATRPATLALTQSEVDRPQRWAVAQVQAALTGGVVLFIGLGTVGLYVSEPVEELVALWTTDATVWIVDPQLPDAWEAALGDRAVESHIAMTSSEFLDDLLRAVMRDALAGVSQSVEMLAEHDAWAAPMRHGYQRLRDALDRVPADGVLRWWRDGVAPAQAGSPFITELSGQRALMTIALLAGREAGALDAQGVRGRLTIGGPSQYFEIICRPGQHIREVETVARDRISRRREEGVYPDERIVTVVVAEAMGEFPAADAPTDIAGGDEEGSDIADGPRVVAIRLLSAEDGVLGRLP